MLLPAVSPPLICWLQQIRRLASLMTVFRITDLQSHRAASLLSDRGCVSQGHPIPRPRLRTCEECFDSDAPRRGADCADCWCQARRQHHWPAEASEQFSVWMCLKQTRSCGIRDIHLPARMPSQRPHRLQVAYRQRAALPRRRR